LTSPSRFRTALLLGCFVALVAVITAGAASAARGKTPSAGGTTTSTTISLVNLTSPGAPPSFGQQVTFNVSTTATAYPWVELRCYQGGTLVYDNSVGYFSSYMFPQVFTVGPTQLWTSGAASCTASVISYDSKRTKTLATLSFGVSA
jgi:hypothetical protein